MRAGGGGGIRWVGLVAFILVEWNGAGQDGQAGLRLRLLPGQHHPSLANHTSFLLTQTDRRSGAAAAGCGILATRPTRIVRLHISAASR
jgi:hypothetical protein